MTLFRSWTFTWKEVALLKWSLASFGVLAGLYFGEHLARVEWLWWILCSTGAAYFITRVVKEYLSA